MLDDAVQGSILRRREAEAESARNRAERNYYFARALFHRYEEATATAWVRDSILQGVTKIYRLKKSGVKMTLDQKYLYDRLMTPVEKALKKILKQAPMKVDNVVSEKQALAAATKAAAAAVARGGKGPAVKKELEEKKRKQDEEAVNGKKRKGKNDTEEADAAGAVKLENMTPLELDKLYMHLFSVFANRMCRMYCRCLNAQIQDLKIKKKIRIAHLTAFQIRHSLDEADEKLKKSPITALLPKVEFQEKVLVAAAKLFAGWELMEEVGSEVCRSFKIKDKDKTWVPSAIGCLSSCLIMKYSAEEKNRTRGENVAASRIQGLLKGFVVRQKIKRIWEAANIRYEKEYELYQEKLLQEKYLREAKEAEAREVRNQLDAEKRVKSLNKIGVDWAEAYIHNTDANKATIQINMRIGGKLPLNDYFRNKNVKCTARMYESAERLRDIYCTEYTKAVEAAPVNHSMSQPKIGKIEVLIDDKKATDEQAAYWKRCEMNTFLPTSLLWDSSTKLKKSKLINVFDTRDDGSDKDIAKCFLTIEGLDFNSCYNVTVLLNPHYNPEADFSEEIKPKVAVLEFVTSPTPPCPPMIGNPDVIHFDHVVGISTNNKKIDELPLLDDDVSGSVDDEVEDLKVDDGLTVVDRLEKFKMQQLERKQTEFNNSSMKKGDPYTELICFTVNISAFTLLTTCVPFICIQLRYVKTKLLQDS